MGGELKRATASTDISDDPSHDNLRLISSPNRRAKVLAIPCVDFSLAVDERRVRVHVRDLLRDRSVRTRVGAGRYHDGQIEEFRDGRVRNDVVSELVWRVVADELE